MARNRFFHAGPAGIIFDCDGVMIDSEDANRYYYNTILKALGHPPMTPDQEKFAFMATAREALLAMLPANLHGRIEEAARTSLDYNRDILPRVKLMPGFREFIDQAHARGVALAIDTNRTREGIQRILDFFHLPPYFNPVISASVAQPKPSPHGAEMICGEWHIKPDDALFVGDSENDRDAAKGAGLVFAAFGGKGLHGDLEAASYAILANLLWGPN